MDFLTSLVNSMPGAVAQGLIWGIMAIGVYITYRILDVADLTVDGSLGTGGAVCVVLVLNGVPVGVALVAATLAGMLAGLVTGLFHTACGIPAILSVIMRVVSTAVFIKRGPCGHVTGVSGPVLRLNAVWIRCS